MMMRYSMEERAKYLEGWEASGKGAWEYAREIGVKGQTFSKWVKKQKSGGQQFVEIKPEISIRSPGGIVIEKGDIRISLPVGLSGKEIRSVMEGTGLLP
jgi:transposase-like protein